MIILDSNVHYVQFNTIVCSVIVTINHHLCLKNLKHNSIKKVSQI